jgi:exonuclease VII large subunit
MGAGGKMEAAKVKADITNTENCSSQKQYAGLKEHKIDKLKVVFFIRNSRGSQFKMTDGSNYKSLLWYE